MPNMSSAELLFALLLVLLMIVLAGVGVLVASLSRRADAQNRGLAELRAELSVGGRSTDVLGAELRDRVSQTQAGMEGLRAALAARQSVEEEARQSLRRLEAIIAGASTRGVAGENILEEAFRHLPPDMVQRNFWVKGKVVEFALRLPSAKHIAIDAKWTSSQALEGLDSPDLEPARRAQLAAQVEKEVERRVREVSQYIDPDTTAPFAMCAIPDAAYGVCRRVFAEAHQRHVVLIGFSMALPYLLTLYQLHLQFARTVDMDNLQGALMEVDRQLDQLEGVLENRLQRAVVMLQNAYGEGKQVAARIRASAHGIQSRNAEPVQLEVLEPERLTLPAEPLFGRHAAVQPEPAGSTSASDRDKP
jgi:DNA recombination protein RmuC